jgi:uncharacterized protein
MKTYDLSRDNTDLYFLERMFGNLLKVAYIRNIMPYGNKFTELLGGICVPGSKISVSVDGKFHICEKMNEFFPIGDCDNGLEHAAIEKIIRMWSESFIRHCNDCPFKALCGACFAVCNNNDTFQFEDFCKNRKAGILNQLSALYTLLEENPDAWAYLTRNESLKLEVLSKYNGVINKC